MNPRPTAVEANQGNGNLAAKPAIEYGTHVSAVDLKIADVDGDGDRDLIVANEGAFEMLAPFLGLYGCNCYLGSSVVVHKNGGNAAFTLLPPIELYDLRVGKLAAEDLDGDGDGDGDVVVPAGDGIATIANDGLGNFEVTGWASGSPGRHHDWLALEDLDGDGDRDAVVAATGGLASLMVVFWQTADGGFERGPAVPFTCGSIQSPAPGDFDRDGDVDIAVPERGAFCTGGREAPHEPEDPLTGRSHPPGSASTAGCPLQQARLCGVAAVTGVALRRHAINSPTTRPCTSVRRKSRPA